MQLYPLDCFVEAISGASFVEVKLQPRYGMAREERLTRPQHPLTEATSVLEVGSRCYAVSWLGPE